MSKISRNDPCPCGSGNKYKKCCMDKVLSFPSKNNFSGNVLSLNTTLDSQEKIVSSKSPQEFINMVKEHFGKHQFNSLEDANRELAKLSEQHNNAAQDDFLGLSSSQMFNIHRRPFSLENEIFTFKIKSENLNDLDQSPVFKHVMFLLAQLKLTGEVKATQKGNLPKKLVLEMYEEFFSKERYARTPSKEDDLLPVGRARHLLEYSGLMKKRNNKFSLTQKGFELVDAQRLREIFELIFLAFVNKWNWGYMDRYPDLTLIQKSAVFNFHILNKKCQGKTLDWEFGQAFYNAFPKLEMEVPERSYSTPQEQIINCFCLRFFHRFCLPLGFVELVEEKVAGSFDEHSYFTKTSLFNSLFTFHV